MASEGQRSAGSLRSAGRPHPDAQRRRPRRTRLARGPLTIGEPAPVLEPRLAGDAELYRPDSVADGGSAFGLTVRAASVRGLYKRYSGGRRQDDVCVRSHEPSGTLIIAVADGVSAAPRSELGAALAVRHACAALIRTLDGEGEIAWEDVFQQAAWALVEEHRRQTGQPDADVAQAAESLSTTLLVAVITGHGEQAEGGPREKTRVRLAAVGDSPAIVLKQGGFETALGTGATSGLVDGSVPALPRAVHEVGSESLELEAEDVLLLCTDGLAMPLGDGSGEVGAALARELANPPDIVDFARLLDFSRATYDDDRTLAAVWMTP